MCDLSWIDPKPATTKAFSLPRFTRQPSPPRLFSRKATLRECLTVSTRSENAPAMEQQKAAPVYFQGAALLIAVTLKNPTRQFDGDK
jgi:hypothetical protein